MNIVEPRKSPQVYFRKFRDAEHGLGWHSQTIDLPDISSILVAKGLESDTNVKDTVRMNWF